MTMPIGMAQIEHKGNWRMSDSFPPRPPFRQPRWHTPDHDRDRQTSFAAAASPEPVEVGVIAKLDEGANEGTSTDQRTL
jgi:hypothetical protein